jgi:myosin protein heavy chain/myosin heavy chain 6/7
MITITILIGIILILSYLLFRENNQQQLNITTQDVQNVAKYNLITKVFLDVFSQSQQLNKKVEILTGDNESLKQEIQKLEQQINTLLQEYQTTLELNNKLQIQNTIFKQRNQDLETNQKSFIQKLGGIVYKENLEDKTWDLVLDKVQVLMNERNEAVIKIQAINQDIEVIKQKNELLVKEKNTFDQSLQVLKSIIATKENEINSLTSKLSGLEFRCEELVKDLQSRTDNSIELEQIKNELKNLQDVIIYKDGLIQSLEIQKGENLQNISLLEASVTNEKSNCKSLTQENMSLHSRVQQLEGEIEVLNNKPVDSDIERLSSQIAQKDNEIKKLEVENNQNIQKIEQLKIKLTEKELELKTTIQDSNNRIQELEKERDFLKWKLSVLSVSDSSGLTEELQKQIAQKDGVIKKLESEKSEILERFNLLAENFDELTEDFNKLTEDFNKLTRNFNQKEYQLEVVTREKNYLDNRVKELETDVKALEEEQSLLIQKLRYKESEISELQQDIVLLNYELIDKETKISELQQDLSSMSKYADDMEEYAEDLEQYYLEELEIYSDTSNINDLELTLDNFTDIDILMIQVLEDLMIMNIKVMLMFYLLRNIR